MRPLKLGFFALSAAFVGALGIGAAQSGCTVLTNDAPPDDATFEAGNEAAVPVCNDCVTQACLGQWSVCLTDDTCRATRACASAGTNANECFCTTTSPTGAYLAFASCNDAKTCTTCTSSCSCSNGSPSTTPASCDGDDAGSDAGDDGGDAAPADAAPPVTVDACTNCINGSCGDPKKACATGTECSAYLACTYACTGASCQDKCASDHATGKESAVELASCVKTSCASACGL